MISTELVDQLRTTHTTPAVDRDAAHRATAYGVRRRNRRHRIAERVRSVADRLEA